VDWLPARSVSLADVLGTLPVLATAYVCHYQAHPILAEMRAPTARRMRKVVNLALGVTTSIYGLTGLSAYLLFTNRTEDDVLKNYGSDLMVPSGVAAAVQASYSLSLVLTFPLIQFALRQNLFDLAGWGDARTQPRRFLGATLLLLLSELGMALLVPSITIAFSLLGSTVAVVIGFVLPGLVAVYAMPDAQRYGRGLLIFGLLLGVASLTATLYGLVHTQAEPPLPRTRHG
jgi:sodium-coupled neutral amino acid transporter 2